jgi:hypothetical protein
MCFVGALFYFFTKISKRVEQKMNIKILVKLVRIKIYCSCKAQLRNEVIYTLQALDSLCDFEREEKKLRMNTKYKT